MAANIRLRKNEAFTAYPNVMKLVDVEIVNQIAHLLINNVSKVGDIVKVLNEKLGIPAQKTVFQIMIMMKYGVFGAAT